MSLTDTGDFAFKPEVDDIAFAAYFVWTVMVLVLLVTRWEWSYSVTSLELLVDVVIFLLIPHLELPHESDIVIGITVLGALAVLKVGLRSGLRQAAYMAAALNLACIANCGIMIVLHHDSHALYLRQIAILAITSVIAMWAAYRITPPKLPPLRLEGAMLSKAALDALLDFAMKAMNSRRGLFVWLEEGQNHTPIGISRNWQKVDVGADVLGSLLWPADAPFRAIMIGGRQGLALRSDKTGKVVKAKLDGSLRKLVPSLQNQTVFIAGIRGLGGEGVIVLGDVILPASDDILLFENVSSALEHALDKLAQAKDERDATIHDTREAIARDLHDSVAQSLAGAKFHLAALLRNDLPANVLAQLSKLKGAIEQEHASIREYIDTLQSKSDSTDNGETQIELHELCQRLANNWNVIVELREESDFNPMDRTELLEIQQIIREAVANSVRHGNASHIEVRCAANDLGMQLSISDNGIGMKPDMVLTAPRSIKARVTTLRGTLKVRSRDTGVELQMFIPVRTGN
ncbi:MAG: sensor histidine kinase [Novosphingobium sp.]